MDDLYHFFHLIIDEYAKYSNYTVHWLHRLRSHDYARLASYWPEKQFVVADYNQDVINAWQYQDFLPVFEPKLQILLAQRRNANLRFSNYIGEEINKA